MLKKQKKPIILKNADIITNLIKTKKKIIKNHIELKNLGTQKWKGKKPNLIKKKINIKKIPNKTKSSILLKNSK